MQTLKFKYKTCSDPEFILSKMKQHSYCLRYVYKRIDESSDSDFYNHCKKKFNLTDIELRSVIANAKQIKTSFLTKIEKTKEEIEMIEYDIEELNEEINKLKEQKQTETRLKKIKNKKRSIFKLRKKLAQKERFVHSDIVFGGKTNLRKISYLSNDKENNMDEIKKHKEEYKKKRLGSVYIIGEANYRGNRFFKFDLLNNKIIYKPFKGKEVEFSFHGRKNMNIEKLQQLIDDKEISVTVSFDGEHIRLTFDESILSGYCIDKKQRREDVARATNGIPDKEKKSEIAKKIYKDHYEQLKEKQLNGKVKNRYCGIDLNPDHIGFSIIDKFDNGKYKIIYKSAFDLKKLNKKSHEASDSDYSIYLRNKRVHEKSQIIHRLFKIMKHYKVSHFIMEDLNFKFNNKKQQREFNRKVNNVWDRELIVKLINKKCTEDGIINDAINPVYTSFIGNFLHKVFDPVGASIEIARRGAFKYDKGHFFPETDLSTDHTVLAQANRFGIDVGLIRDRSWKDIHTIFNKFRYRWGRSVGEPDLFSVKSYRSRTKQLVYN